MQHLYPHRPYHNLPNDLLTAYVHIVVLQGWVFWRLNLKDAKMLAVLEGLRKAPSKRLERYRRYVNRFCSFFVIVMVVMSGIVLAGFALPAQLEGGNSLDDATQR